MEYAIRVIYNNKDRTFIYDKNQTLYEKSVYIDKFEVQADLTSNQTMYVCFENKETNIKTKNIALIKNDNIYFCKIPSKVLSTGTINAYVSIFEPIATQEGQTKYSCITNQTITFNCDYSDSGNGIEGVELSQSETLVNNLVNATNNATNLANDIKENYVKTSKTINSLAVGDTLFVGDEVIFNIDQNKLLEYFLKEPIWTHIYLVNKDTNKGFRFACYVKHIYDKRNANNVLEEKKYVIDIQVYYIEGNTKQFVLEKSIPVIVTYTLGFIPTPSFPEGVETQYSFVNEIKDISNLYIHYTNSLKENNAGEGFIGGITAQKVGEVQDTLLNHNDGVETPINDYVKVKNDKLVKVVDNVEKLLPITEETHKKLDELKDKINGSHTVNISKFALNASTNTWYTDSEIKNVTPSEGNGAKYVVNTNDGLYYYSYNDIIENVGIIKGNSAFEEKTVNGKLQYTSNKISTIREGTPARVDKSVKGLSSVSFDLYMTGLGSTNQYYPEIAFVVDEGRRIAIETQFSCYNSSFQLKIIRKDRNPITVATLPYSNGIFNANVKIEIKNDYSINAETGQKENRVLFTAYINDKPYDKDITSICPELIDFGNLENVYFGLRYDATPPTNWGFSNVVFGKEYWQQGYKIKNDTLYVNLEDNSLYRYTNDKNTTPYPNFIKITSSNKELKSNEKIIHITEYTTQDTISFSMQGYSHFQIIQATGAEGGEKEEAWGEPFKKTDANKRNVSVTYWSTLNDAQIRGGKFCSVAYEDDIDMVFLNFEGPLYSDIAELSVYIRLFNVEEV